MAHPNVETSKKVYAAFAKGDIAEVGVIHLTGPTQVRLLSMVDRLAGGRGRAGVRGPSAG